MKISNQSPQWIWHTVAVLCVSVLYGCAPQTETPQVESSPISPTNPVPAVAAINAQKRQMLERRLADVQGNTALPAEMKAKAIEDLKKQLAELPEK